MKKKPVGRLSLGVCLLVGSGLWAGCGGGSSDGAATGGEAGPTPGTTAANPFNPLVGTYVVACNGRTNGNAVNAAGSAEGSVTVGPLVGTDRAQVTLHFRDYTDTACSDAALKTDATVDGEIRDLGQTKAYVLNGQTVTAQVVEFTYRQLGSTQGTFTGSLPTPGVTAKAAYLLVNNRLYLSKGHRDANGVGDRLDGNFGVKQ